MPITVDPRDEVFLDLDTLFYGRFEPIFRHGADALPLGRLSGHVYFDLDGNGRFDRGEPGIAGVATRLVGSPEAGGRLERIAETDKRGFYLFTDLPPGTYDVSHEQPERLVRGGFAWGRSTA